MAFGTFLIFTLNRASCAANDKRLFGERNWKEVGGSGEETEEVEEEDNLLLKDDELLFTGEVIGEVF